MKVFEIISLPNRSTACWSRCSQLQQQPPRHQADAQYQACTCLLQRPSCHGSYSVAVVVVVVGGGTNPPVTGNCARRLHGSTPHHDVGPKNHVVLRIAVFLLAVAGTEAGESPRV